MKRFLRSLCILFLMGTAGTLYAQCDIRNSSFNIKNTQANGAGCKVTFDFSFEMNNNGGNKIVVIQAWKEASYPNYWKCSATNSSNVNKSPNGTDLGAGGAQPFLNIAFDLSTSPATVLSAYGPDNGVTLQGGYTVQADPADVDAQGYFTVTVTDMVVTVPSQVCGGAITIKADVWSSQGNITSPWPPHCVICGNTFAFNYPLVAARIVDCDLPRQYELSINNINTNQTISSTWKTYINNGPLTLGDEDVLVDEQTTAVIIPPQSIEVYSSTWDGSGIPPGSNASLIVEVTTVGLENTQLADAPNPCQPLPVHMRSFTAQRNKGIVAINWETATEQNNRGFNLQRNTRGAWENIAFVFSAADDGNSSGTLSYSFNDHNNEKGMSQYRIQQVDMDGRATYSIIRAVRGVGQSAKTIVYPNPSSNGKVSVVFEDGGTKAIRISDISGRVVRQYRNAVNNLLVEGLEGGMYSIQITDLSSGVSTTEKVIIKKR